MEVLIIYGYTITKGFGGATESSKAKTMGAFSFHNY